MAFSKNFHPEWGYLAPAPAFIRTMRTVLVASAVGAVAGAATVLSVVEHSPADADQSVATRTLVGTVVADATSGSGQALATLHACEPALRSSVP